MSISKSNDYNQFKIHKEVLDRNRDNAINDFTDVSNLESVYCDLCDRMLVEWEVNKLICPVCHIITDPKFTLVKHHAKEGPVDLEDDGSNDISIISEYYNFKPGQGQRQEEKDIYIDSLKARGYQIINSTKK